MPEWSAPRPLDRILPALIDDLRSTLGEDLVGAYLYGSAVSGGFDSALSDLDVAVVTERSVDAIDFNVVAGIIDRLCAREPDWCGRLDIDFVGRQTLASARTGGPFLEISHKNPLQLIRRADEWLETWFLVRDADCPLVGPSATSLIPPIGIDEFLHVLVIDVDRYVAAVRLDWRDGEIAYRVLTVCRLLRSLESRAICSKQEGAELAIAKYPEWAWLIRAAWAVRMDEVGRPFTPAERAQVPALLAFLASEVGRTSSGPAGRTGPS